MLDSERSARYRASARRRMERGRPAHGLIRIGADPVESPRLHERARFTFMGSALIAPVVVKPRMRKLVSDDAVKVPDRRRLIEHDQRPSTLHAVRAQCEATSVSIEANEGASAHREPSHARRQQRYHLDDRAV